MQKIDYAYWAKMSYWTIEQSTALLIDADPDSMLDGGSLAVSCPADLRERYLNARCLLSGLPVNRAQAFAEFFRVRNGAA